MPLDKDLRRWVDAQLIDAVTADRIGQFEKENRQERLRWPAMIAIAFGILLLCAGVLLFVAAHWDKLSPTQRFALVAGMVAVFHIAAGLSAGRVPAMGTGLHFAGTVALGAGVYLSGQIFNLQEHWPGGILLWTVGAVIAWLILRQWPQALLASVLVPVWLAAEWSLATERYSQAWNITAQAFLLLAILYFSVPQRDAQKHLRAGLMWIGCFALLPLLAVLFWSSVSSSVSSGDDASQRLPLSWQVLGYVGAYVPTLLIALAVRKRNGIPVVLAGVWVLVLGILAHRSRTEPGIISYVWMAIGACALCYWGVRRNRKLFVNFGTAIFALNVLVFFFSDIFDKLGRAEGLILMGIVFLAGGWVLHRIRGDLMARIAPTGAPE
jgi:uncharacterized membrane protein